MAGDGEGAPRLQFELAQVHTHVVVAVGGVAALRVAAGEAGGGVEGLREMQGAAGRLDAGVAVHELSVTRLPRGRKRHRLRERVSTKCLARTGGGGTRRFWFGRERVLGLEGLKVGRLGREVGVRAVGEIPGEFVVLVDSEIRKLGKLNLKCDDIAIDGENLRLQILLHVFSFLRGLELNEDLGTRFVVKEEHFYDFVNSITHLPCQRGHTPTFTISISEKGDSEQPHMVTKRI